MAASALDERATALADGGSRVTSDGTRCEDGTAGTQAGSEKGVTAPGSDRHRHNRVEERKLQREQRKQQLQEARAAAKARAALSAERNEDNYDGEYGSEDEDDGPAVLEVKASTIPNAGDGLFLASRFAPAGSVLLEEEAIAIRRPAAKAILNSPAWRGLHPVIQGTGDRFLDIRKLLLYKSNHIESTSTRCNAWISQTGPATLRLTALRNVWRGEEIMWEYAKTMQFGD